MNKRAIAILGAIFLLIVATVGFLVYQKYFKAADTGEQVADQTDTQDSTEQQTPAASNNAVKLVDEQVVSPILFYQGDGITYFNQRGQLFKNKLQTSGASVLLTDKEEVGLPLKSGINKVYWPQNGDNYLAEIVAGGRTSYSVFYNAVEGYVDLPSKITSIDWLPSGQQIIYLWLDNGKTTLFQANADNTNYKKLADIWENDDKIHVSPDGRNILYYRTTSTDSVNKINLVTSDGQTFRSVVKDGYNIGVNWSPDSKRFVFGRRDPVTLQIQLWMGNIETGEIKNLNITTIPSKVIWSGSGDKVIAAVPKQPTSGTAHSEDMVYMVDVLTNQKQTFDPGISVDVEDPFLSLSADRLFFRNARDGNLYYMNLAN